MPSIDTFFNSQHAVIYGVDKAILINKILYQHDLLTANGDSPWVANTGKAWAHFMPYFSEAKIYRLISELEEADVLIVRYVKGEAKTRQITFSDWFIKQERSNAPAKPEKKKPVDKKPAMEKEPAKYGPEHKEVAEAYDDLYRKKYGEKPTNWNQSAAIIKQLLIMTGGDSKKIIQKLKIFFAKDAYSPADGGRKNMAYFKGCYDSIDTGSRLKIRVERELSDRPIGEEEK